MVGGSTRTMRKRKVAGDEAASKSKVKNVAKGEVAIGKPSPSKPKGKQTRRKDSREYRDIIEPVINNNAVPCEVSDGQTLDKQPLPVHSKQIAEQIESIEQQFNEGFQDHVQIEVDQQGAEEFFTDDEGSATEHNHREDGEMSESDISEDSAGEYVDDQGIGDSASSSGVVTFRQPDFDQWRGNPAFQTFI